jgi:hypothetical protein
MPPFPFIADVDGAGQNDAFMFRYAEQSSGKGPINRLEQAIIESKINHIGISQPLKSALG